MTKGLVGFCGVIGRLIVVGGSRADEEWNVGKVLHQ